MQYRAEFGMEALPLDGRVIPTLMQRIRSGCVIALAADRDALRFPDRILDGEVERDGADRGPDADAARCLARDDHRGL